jgi:hypothetical protein
VFISDTVPVVGGADEIRLGRYRIKNLNLAMLQSSNSAATEAVKAVASAIREDRHLESLELAMEDGFTDEAGVALAEAFTINNTLPLLLLDDEICNPVHTKAYLGAQAYEALGTMLRVNTSIELVHPMFDAAAGDERDTEHFHQMRIEQRLNEVGLGRLLASIQTPIEEWVHALKDLNVSNDDDLFEVGCLYSLLRLNPSIFIFDLNDTANSVL